MRLPRFVEILVQIINELCLNFCSYRVCQWLTPLRAWSRLTAPNLSWLAGSVRWAGTGLLTTAATTSTNLTGELPGTSTTGSCPRTTRMESRPLESPLVGSPCPTHGWCRACCTRTTASTTTRWRWCWWPGDSSWTTTSPSQQRPGRVGTEHSDYRYYTL